MKTSDAIAIYGSQRALAEAMGLSQPSVANWGEYPPVLRQLQIEALTKGQLKAEPEADPFRVAA